MNRKQTIYICPDENELAMFVEGTLTGERLTIVKRHLESCQLCNESVRLAMELTTIDVESISEPEIVSAFAARADRKLCVLYVEQYILQSLGYSVSIDELLTIAKKNKWIKRQGVQIKNIGKLLEYHSIKVERKVDATLADLQNALLRGHSVIVGVDDGELFAKSRIRRVAEKIEDIFEQQADHVLLVKKVISENEIEAKVEILNIDAGEATPLKTSVSRFLDAWKDSKNFMVVISK